jgi:signal transduction histidine kinase
MDARSDEPVEDSDLRFLRLVAMKLSSELERERQLGQLRSDLDATTQSLEATQRQLVQSEKLAVTGTLSASVAHDIRNILAAVALDLELGADDPAATLANVRSHLDRFSLLAQRLLSYARPRMTAHASVDLALLLDRVLSLLEGHARIHDVRATLEVRGQVPEVLGEPGQLELLFVNLILNAVQAMPQGGKVTVTLSAERARVTVSVKDTGTGVPPAVAERLFEPFSSTRPEGFGLGLFSCRRIAEDHGGSIALRTSSARGSTFTVTLPLP